MDKSVGGAVIYNDLRFRRSQSIFGRQQKEHKNQLDAVAGPKKEKNPKLRSTRMAVDESRDERKIVCEKDGVGKN